MGEILTGMALIWFGASLWTVAYKLYDRMTNARESVYITGIITSVILGFTLMVPGGILILKAILNGIVL